MNGRAGGGTRAFFSLLPVFAVAITPRAAGAGDVGVPAIVAVPLENRFATVGAGRCGAAACHGSAQPVFGARTLRNEYATWLQRDPHTRAYQVLKSPWSCTIVDKLWRPGSPKIPAHENDRCLACHATPGPAADPARAALIREDGVGCESCHGPAGTWLGVHNSYTWDVLSPRDKQQRFGMAETRGLAARVSTCVRCHVGESGREVDHDLIAAGHPRLIFEFSAYLANMPAHWLEKDRNAADDFPARAWAIGQVVTARAALEMLQHRAQSASEHPKAPGRWPEFAEYDCAACHRSLKFPLSSSSGARAGTEPGVPSWGTWPLPMLETLATLDSASDAKSFHSSLQALRGSMREMVPDTKDVAEKSGVVIATLSRWLETVQQESFGPPRVQDIVAKLPKTKAEWLAARGRGWDHDTQEYLALVALRQSLPASARDRAGLLEELFSRQRELKSPFVGARNRPIQAAR